MRKKRQTSHLGGKLSSVILCWRDTSSTEGTLYGYIEFATQRASPRAAND
jgi:hypothetical protein